MSASIEEFFTNHEHTVAALEAGSTFAAVVVSLWLALASQRANRTRLKASAAISIILHDLVEDKNNPPTYLTLNITNTGIMPLMIPYSFFHWKVPFKRGVWLVHPLDSFRGDEWIPQKTYPVEIRPKASITFFISDISVFRDMMRKEFLNRTSFKERCQFHFLRPRVITDDGAIFKVTMGGDLQEEIRKLRDSTKIR